jgi:O-antigen/teichoic acid export membrane protein
MVIVSVLNYLFLNIQAGIGFFFKVNFKRWRHLVGKSAWGFLFAICQRVIQQFDFAVLGLYAMQSEVGLYFFAFSLSVQAVGLLSGSLVPVLFPALNRVAKGGDIHLKSILIKFATLLSLFGMPFALWQAVSAKPLILIFLPVKWHDSIYLVQILSFGVGFQIVSTLWMTALRVKADFRRQALYSFVSSIYFLVLIIPFTCYFKSTGTATAVTLFNLTASPILIFYSFRYFNIGFIEIMRPLLKYFMLSIIIFGGNYIWSSYIGSIYFSLLINGFFSPFVYLGIVYLFDGDILNELFYKIRNAARFNKTVRSS